MLVALVAVKPFGGCQLLPQCFGLSREPCAHLLSIAGRRGALLEGLAARGQLGLGQLRPLAQRYRGGGLSLELCQRGQPFASLRAEPLELGFVALTKCLYLRSLAQCGIHFSSGT